MGDFLNCVVSKAGEAEEFDGGDGSEGMEKGGKKNDERNHDKYRSKEQKDKKKQEHKKSKTKHKNKKYIKLRPIKLRLKRSGEHILPVEMPAPKIPKLKIRFGSNSGGISASPSDIVSAASQPILTSSLSAQLGIGFTGGQESAEKTATSVNPKANAGFEKRNVQQPKDKRLRMNDGQKEFLESSFSAHDGAAFCSAKKVLKTSGKEKTNESCVQGITLKGLGKVTVADTSSTLLTHGQQQEKECLKKDLEENLFKRKSDQAYGETELDALKPKLEREKDSCKARMCDGNLLFDKEQSFGKRCLSEKLSSEGPEKEKDRHHSVEMMKENGLEKGSQYVQKASEKEKDQGKRDEKDLEMANEKKEAQQDQQKGKGNSGGKKKGSGESDKGKGKKVVMTGAKSGDISIGKCFGWTTENDKKHREELGKIVVSGEQRKPKNKNEEREKDGEKDAKKHTKEKGSSYGLKEKGKYRNEGTIVEGKVKGCDKEFKDKEKKKKHSSGGQSKEHNTGKNNKETGNVVFSAEDEGFGSFSNVKMKNSGQDEFTGDSNNKLSCDLQKTERVIFAKEQLSKRCSSDSDIFGSRSSTVDSLAKSSDKKSAATLDSEDSLDTMWICPECSVAYVEGATDMVGCDACDNWFHWSCVGLLVAPPDDAPWYCQNCAKRKLKKKSMLKSSTSKKSKK